MVSNWVLKKTEVILMLSFIFVLTGYAVGGITGSAHDFSSEAWSSGKICLPCHTPHNANSSIQDAPLWNHEITTASYILYSSPTLQETPEQPGSVSKLCLSCHDGTVALESFGGNSGSNFISSNALIGTNLSDDHPISIQWSHQDVNGNQCSNCHDVHQNPSFISVLPFYNGKVECATCHDPHNGYNYTKLLRKSLAASEICFHCHHK